jgi:hypothetical protein
MPRNRHSVCPETGTRAPNPAQWDTRFLGKPFHTWHPGMEWWKEKHEGRVGMMPNGKARGGEGG